MIQLSDRLSLLALLLLVGIWCMLASRLAYRTRVQKLAVENVVACDGRAVTAEAEEIDSTFLANLLNTVTTVELPTVSGDEGMISSLVDLPSLEYINYSESAAYDAALLSMIRARFPNAVADHPLEEMAEDFSTFVESLRADRSSMGGHAGEVSD